MRTYLLLILLTASLFSYSQKEQPNIIFILVDDMGYGDLGKFFQDNHTGNSFDTPFLDKMAEEGMMITDHYTTPLCAPSRSMFLEGLTSGHCSARDNFFDIPLPIDLNVPKMLQLAGYKTYMVGKHGLAGFKPNFVSHPLDNGFDDFFGYLDHTAAHEHYPRNGTTDKEAFIYDGFQKITEGTEKTYTTDLYTARAKQKIIDHQREYPDQPFFYYVAYDVPHQKMQIPTSEYPEGKGVNGGVQWTGPNSNTPFVNTAFGTIDSWNYPSVIDKPWPEVEKKHVSMMLRLDECIGDLIQTLKDLNIDENTLVVFTSDNGPHTSEGHRAVYFQSFAQFRGQKTDIFEGGIRVPVIARWPGTIETNSVSDHPSGMWNWGATFADAASCPIPARMDGASLLPILHGKDIDDDLPPFVEFWDPRESHRHMQAIRMDNYVGVRDQIMSNEEPLEIYDIKTDPKQQQNLAEQLPALQKKMKNQLLRSRLRHPERERPFDKTLIPAIQGASTENGLNLTFIEGEFDYLPRLKNIEGITKKQCDSIDLNAIPFENNFAAVFEGFIYIPNDGGYIFTMNSSAPAHFMIHDIHVFGEDLNHSTKEVIQEISLEAGFHPIKLYYKQDTQAEKRIELFYKGPGMLRQQIPSSALFKESNLPIFVKNYFQLRNQESDQILFGDNFKGIPTLIEESQFSEFANWNYKYNGFSNLLIEHTKSGLYLSYDENKNLLLTNETEAKSWRKSIDLNTDWFTLQADDLDAWLSYENGNLILLEEVPSNDRSKWREDQLTLVDTSVISTEPVFIRHRSSNRKLFGDQSGDLVGTASPSETNLEVQWVLQDAGMDGGYFYLNHLQSGKKLNSEGDFTTVELIDSDLAGENALWKCVGVIDNAEWFSIEHKTSRRWLHVAADGSSTFGIGPRLWDGPNTRWRPELVSDLEDIVLEKDTVQICHNSSGNQLFADFFGNNLGSISPDFSGEESQWISEDVDKDCFFLIHKPSGRKLGSEGYFTTLENMDPSITSDLVRWSWEEIPGDSVWFRLVHKASNKFLHLGADGIGSFTLGPTSWTGNNTRWRPKSPVLNTIIDTIKIQHNSSNSFLYNDDNNRIGVITVNSNLFLEESIWISEANGGKYFFLTNEKSNKKLAGDSNSFSIKTVDFEDTSDEALWTWEPIFGNDEWFRLTNKATNRWLHISSDGVSNFTLGPRDLTGFNTMWKPIKQFGKQPSTNYIFSPNIDNENKLEIFPNPSDRIINVKFKAVLDKITIQNSVGVLIYDEKINTENGINNEINLEELPNGLYYLTVYPKVGLPVSDTFRIEK